ncbi:beta-galactosidase subunit beta [Spirochaetia bacterium]|nr:beta-galactosidase subunit beta [Spirochaetia bacterium]
MIIDSITNMDLYVHIVPGLKTVIKVIESGTLVTGALGEHPTDDPKVRYKLMEYTTKDEAPNNYEIHRKEIDVQILLKGKERMDLHWRDPVKTVIEFDEAADIGRVIGEPAISYHANTKTFAVFFPGEPHACNLTDEVSGKNRKVCFKILF